MLQRQRHPGCVLEQLLQQPSLRPDPRYKALVDVLPSTETELVTQARPQLPSSVHYLRTLLEG